MASASKPAAPQRSGPLGYVASVFDFNFRNPAVRRANLWMLKNVAIFAVGVSFFHFRGEDFAV